MLCTMEDVMDMVAEITELCDIGGEYPARETLTALIGMMKGNIERDFERPDGALDAES
ncbi:MAG: hypothetical protein GX224_06115 [Thermoplasmatales archaeon]|nr:hypothetical protein [Thermoplasmatales archaeon]